MSARSYRLPALTFAALLLAGGALASENAGPEPYAAADPHYAAPMVKEPLVKKLGADTAASLGNADAITGPAAGPEPYSAPDPKD